MKRILFTCLVALFAGGTLHVNAQNLLEPTQSGFQRIDQYYRSLQLNLIGKPIGAFCPRFGVLCIPTNQTEWLLSCDINGNSNTLKLAVAKENIYSKGHFHIKDKAIKTKVRKFRLCITDSQRDALDSLFMYSTATTYYELHNPFWLTDGVRYIFMSKFQSGECYSPEYGYTAELVQIAYKLGNIVVRKDLKALDDLMPEVERLTEKFRTMYRKMEEVQTGDSRNFETDSKTESR